MKLKPRVLTDEELVGACIAKAEAGSAFVDSNLQAERREVTMYYQGKKPFPLREGGSKFVSQDVYEAVEATKAQLTEAYSAGNNIVSFAPQNAEDVPLATQATEYCEHVFFAQNDGLEIINGVIHDSSMNRVGVAQVYWDRGEITTSETFDNVPVQEAHQLLADPAVRLAAKPTVNTDGTVSGEIERVADSRPV